MTKQNLDLNVHDYEHQMGDACYQPIGNEPLYTAQSLETKKLQCLVVIQYGYRKQGARENEQTSISMSEILTITG